MEKINRFDVQVTEPKSIWQRPLKADFGNLFKAIAKGLVHFTVAKWDELASDTVGAIAAIGLKQDPQERAWLLLQRSMARAIFALVGEISDLLRNSPANVDEACDRSQAILEMQDVYINEEFFRRPGEIVIVPAMQQSLQCWLAAYGLDEKQSASIAARLPSFFVYALHREWISNRLIYGDIRDTIVSPFKTAADRRYRWDMYAAWMNREVDRRMFYETFGLRQVFVSPRGYFERKNSLSDSELTKHSKTSRQVIDVRDTLDAWLECRDRQDAIRVISGGPGSGKSSFSRIYAADLLNAGKLVAYIPLHQLDLKDRLESALDDFCRHHELLPNRLLDADEGESDLLIIFDGLDELSKQGAAALEVANQFVREVERAVRDRNQAELHVRVLLNGRPISIQANESEFRREGQVIHFLPFVLTRDETINYDDVLELLEGENNDQRNTWWRLYGFATGRGYEEMPQQLRRTDLLEVTREPLLNYLVAVTFERGTLDFSTDINLNQIYRDLLASVFKREWEGRPFETVRTLSQDEFEQILEEIALATWHGDGRTTTVKAIVEHCEGSGLSRLLNTFQEGAEAGATRLLAAFYFRQHGKVQGEKTFEFTHKSFGEYLVARRLVRALRKVKSDLEARKHDIDKGTDEATALEHWIKVFGPTPFDTDLRRYVINEICLENYDAVGEYHDCAVALLSFELKHGLPLKELAQLRSFAAAQRRARNAEESLLLFRCVCANRLERVSEIDWPNATAAGEMICRLRGQRDTPITIATDSMARIDLRQQELYCCDLYGADLQGSMLQGTTLSYAILEDARLGIVSKRLNQFVF